VDQRANRDGGLKYMGEVIEEIDLSPHIRYRHHISSAGWSSADNLWTIEA
jgi:cation diffusion facilitator CzcD-associated flavoprotein CzcO